jgi:hypothetical protein
LAFEFESVYKEMTLADGQLMGSRWAADGQPMGLWHWIPSAIVHTVFFSAF